MSDELEILGAEALVVIPGGSLSESPAPDAESPPPAANLWQRADPRFHWILLLLSVAIVSLSMILSVRDRRQVLVPVLGAPLPELCLAKRWTQRGCPGCGMTRCFISIGHGRLAEAWSYNPAGVWFFAIVLFQIPYRSVQLWRLRRGLLELRIGWLAQISLGILATGMIGQWLLRICGVDF